jgi:hypothetical protein
VWVSYPTVLCILGLLDAAPPLSQTPFSFSWVGSSARRRKGIKEGKKPATKSRNKTVKEKPRKGGTGARKNSSILLDVDEDEFLETESLDLEVNADTDTYTSSAYSWETAFSHIHPRLGNPPDLGVFCFLP